jgi:hypothetical protein
MSPQIYPRTTMTEQKAYNVGPSYIDLAHERLGGDVSSAAYTLADMAADAVGFATRIAGLVDRVERQP